MDKPLSPEAARRHYLWDLAVFGRWQFHRMFLEDAIGWWCIQCEGPVWWSRHRYGARCDHYTYHVGIPQPGWWGTIGPEHLPGSAASDGSRDWVWMWRQRGRGQPYSSHCYPSPPVRIEELLQALPVLALPPGCPVPVK